VNFREKIIIPEQLPTWRQTLRDSGRKLVVTNGCFDILHLGHVTYLETARNQGDVLLVGLNSDAAVRNLKGAGRPVNIQEDRAAVLAALESVDAVSVFDDRSATGFLALARPDIYVKGGDYTLDTINQQERKVVEAGGGQVRILSFVPGKSTTSLLEQILKL
jgi:rfaE bifunctional protein nucleotidyltransferase chain/domain